MCATCSENGAQAQCPTCRQLVGDGFPYDANADLGTLFNLSWDAFKREWAMLLVTLLVAFAMLAAGGIIANIVTSIVMRVLSIEVNAAKPLSNLSGFFAQLGIQQVAGAVIGLPIQGVALVGLFRVFVDVLMGRKADVSRMFTQIHLLWPYVLTHLMLMVVTTLPIVLIGATFGAAAFNADSFRDDPIRAVTLLAVPLVFGGILFTVLAFFALPVTLYATTELVISECTAVEAITRTWRVGSGQRWRIFGYSFVGGLMILAGFFACLVGMIPAVPVAELLFVALYLALRRSSDLPPATRL